MEKVIAKSVRPPPKGFEYYLDTDGEWHIRWHRPRLLLFGKITGIIVIALAMLWLLIGILRWMWGHPPF